MLQESEWLINILSKIIELKAVNPAFGGSGEEKRAEYIEKILRDMGFPVKRYDFIDYSGLTRPNLIVEVGKGEKIWLIAHIDTVGAGSGWTKNPFKLTIENGKLYGRGVSDDGVGIAALLILLRRIYEEKFDPNKKVVFAFVADEESGSKYGVKALVESGVISGGNAIIPDFGAKRGDQVEIAEKGILWLKTIVNGKQGHASMPHLAENAHLKNARFIRYMYDYLHKKYSEQNEFFEPPYSTFEPTRHDQNVESINIIPGVDISYWDCRVLPQYDLDDIINDFIEKIKQFNGNIEVIIREDASYTDPNSTIVTSIRRAIQEVLGITPRLVGIGGGTVAGILRKAGIDSVAWSVVSETEHKPDEYELIENYFKTADVIQHIILSDFNDG